MRGVGGGRNNLGWVSMVFVTSAQLLVTGLFKSTDHFTTTSQTPSSAGLVIGRCLWV